MMGDDVKPTMILQGVLGLFIMPDRKPQGSTLPQFTQIFEGYANYKIDALIKADLRFRYTILCKKKMVINEVVAAYIGDLRRYFRLSRCYLVWTMALLYWRSQIPYILHQGNTCNVHSQPIETLSWSK